MPTLPDADDADDADADIANDADADGVRRPDLRMPALGALAWAATLLGLLTPGWVAISVLLVVVALVGAGAAYAQDQVRPVAPTLLGALIVVLAAVGVASLHRAANETGPLADLSREEASVRAEARVVSDPRLREGDFSDFVILRVEITELTGRGRTYDLAARVVVLAPPTWEQLELGAHVEVAGRLAPADGDAVALLRARGDPVVTQAPHAAWRGAARVRAAIRASVDHRPADEAVLVPSLVVGDDAGLDPDLAADFNTTGLTHLTAVSGTNLTLIVGFLLIVARGLGVRGRWQVLVGAVGIVGFVLLARTEPSVVRAAAMGTVALLGMGRNGLQRGTRGLGVAVTVLLLFSPWLALNAGFALSSLATAGILFLAPGWRDALNRWLPAWCRRWHVAEAIAVPAAAQLACTPVVAGISGQVSLVAVLANLLVAPAVAPATVLGLAGGLVGLVSEPASRVPGTVAAWCVGWIITVAQWGAALPLAALDWGRSALALAALVALCLALSWVAPRLLRRRWVSVVVIVTAALAVAVPTRWWPSLPVIGWPPDGWEMVVCDVGQGDALVLRVGEADPQAGVVVDTGNDPDAVDGCLRDLGIERVPLLILTHFHDDHAGAVAAVLRDREVGAIEVSPLAEPAQLAEEVARLAVAAGVPVQPAALGSVRSVGQVTLEVLGPDRVAESAGASDGEGSAANDASVVLLARIGQVDVLLTGDIEPPAQRRVLRALAQRGTPVDVDVLKVPHHGSSHQDLDLLTGVQPELAVISVGADNTYGHPAPDLLAALSAAGIEVHRTDLGSDLAVVDDGDQIAVEERSG